MIDLTNKSILLTGGTGFFGKAFIKKLIETSNTPKRLVVFSRDELKQFEMSQTLPESDYPFLRYFLGDVRDLNRLNFAMEGIDTVIHAAALKQVPAAEYNPFEFIKTNIIGAQNIIESALKNSVENIVALSTDKAASPINLYGATKLCSDKLFIASNNAKGARKFKASVVRYGNVMGSRGSVIPYFLKQKSSGVLTITHDDMTRFNITLDEGVDMVLWSLKNALGGEIFVPKIPSYKILDLAEAICSKCEIKRVGIRPGEKMHEEMISVTDGINCYDLGRYYVIAPNIQSVIDYYEENSSYFKVKEGFSYNSKNNEKFLTVEELKGLIDKL